jgi:3-methyladenine DNA glycosylase Mpg
VRSPSTRGLDIIVTPRIGITRAADWPLRFLIKDSPWVSQGPSVTPSLALPRA